MERAVNALVMVYLTVAGSLLIFMQHLLVRLGFIQSLDGRWHRHLSEDEQFAQVVLFGHLGEIPEEEQ